MTETPEASRKDTSDRSRTRRVVPGRIDLRRPRIATMTRRRSRRKRPRRPRTQYAPNGWQALCSTPLIRRLAAPSIRLGPPVGGVLRAVCSASIRLRRPMTLCHPYLQDSRSGRSGSRLRIAGSAVPAVGWLIVSRDRRLISTFSVLSRRGVTDEAIPVQAQRGSHFSVRGGTRSRW